MGMLRSLVGTVRGREASFVVALLVLAAPAAVVGSTPGLEDPASDAWVAEATQEALTIVQSTGDYRKAAESLVESVDDLDAGDPAAVPLLVLAARLYHHGEDEGSAYRTFRRAGSLAYAAGMGLQAAHSLLDAAVVASERGREAEVREAADLAGYVIRTADLTPEERTSILRRVEYVLG